MARFSAPPLPQWLDAQVPFSRYRIEVGGRLLHVMEQGEGPPVLLLHGNPTWSFLWRRVALLLKGAPLRLVMPDLLGLGLSEQPTDPGVHTLETHSALIGGLIDALKLEPLVFVGQDWGGPIGVHALATRAAAVRGMVILNTVLGPPRADFRPTSFHRFARMPVVSDLAFRVGGFMPRGMSRAQGDPHSLDGEVGRAYRWVLRDWRTRIAPLALARMVPDSMNHPSIPGLRKCEEFTRAFTGPAELVWGDRDPVLGRVRKHISTLLPHARVTATQAGHFLQEEVPDVIAGAIRRVAG